MIEKHSSLISFPCNCPFGVMRRGASDLLT